MHLVLKLILGAVFIAYPFLIYFGISHFALWELALVVGLMAGIRMSVLKPASSPVAKVSFFALIALLLFSLISIVLDQYAWLKLYPIIVSLMMLVLFVSSLYSKKSAIQRFAELKEKNIDAKKQAYMYKLTIIWSAFFLINASISTYTMCCSTLKQWTLYNGLISYLLIGLLLSGELLYRYLVVKKR